MAEHRRVVDILGAIADREQIHGLVEPRVPPALKYKKDRPGEKNLPDMKVGTKLVIRFSRNGWGSGDVLGYALGIVIDFYDRSGHSTYYTSINALVQIVRVTHPDLAHMIGRIRSAEVGDYWGSAFFVPEQVQLSDYKWIDVPDAPRPLAY